MPNSKNYSTRLRVLDRYLSSGHAYTGRELLDFCNQELKARGEATISSRTTLFDDLLNIENEYKVSISRERRGRHTFYKYKDPNFSIFSTDLTDDDWLHLQEAMDVIRKFEGMPQFEWMSELSMHMNLSKSICENLAPIVGFESPFYNKGIEFFTPLFDAIRYKRPLTLVYQSFKRSEPREFVIHPYYLKQYNNRWFLCCANEEYPDTLSVFALDRIKSITLAHVPYREIQIDFNEYFEDFIGITKLSDKQSEKVLLYFSKGEYRYVETKPWHGSQRKVGEDENGVFVEYDVIINFELEQKILAFADFVTVLQPESLRLTILNRTMLALQNYERAAPKKIE